MNEVQSVNQYSFFMKIVYDIRDTHEQAYKKYAYILVHAIKINEFKEINLEFWFFIIVSTVISFDFNYISN